MSITDKAISSQAQKREGSTTILFRSTAKRLEAQSTLSMQGDDIVCSTGKLVEGRELASLIATQRTVSCSTNSAWNLTSAMAVQTAIEKFRELLEHLKPVRAMAISSQAQKFEYSGKVQRLSRKGVGPSGPKRGTSMKMDDDIVCPAWKHAEGREQRTRSQHMSYAFETLEFYIPFAGGVLTGVNNSVN